MKKYIALMGVWFWAAGVLAGECVGGTWVTANSVANNPDICTEATCNGATFCKSSRQVNWWSAFTWCASNGLHLATFQEMCPGISTGFPTTCVNLKGVGGDQWVWSSLGYGDGYAYRVQLSDGGVTNSWSTNARNSNAVALCR